MPDVDAHSDRPTPTIELIAHLQYGLGDQVRPRLDDQLVVELRAIADDATATATDALAAVDRAARTTAAGRPLVITTTDDHATRWAAVLRSDLDAILTVTPAGPERDLPLFDAVYRRLGDLAGDTPAEHDPQRVWMRFHAAIGRMAPQGR